jgi:rhodanese-related sulfurtransferase
MKTDRIARKTWRAIWQSGVIIILSAVVGLLTNQGRSNTLPLVAEWSPESKLTADSMESLVISLEEAKTLCSDKGAVFLDARSPEDYAQGHIRCAQNIPWQSFDEYLDRVFNMIPDDAWIVTYCDGETCSLSEDLAKELVSMGYEKVKVLLNGWTRWLEAGFPIEVVKNASCEKHRIS